MDHILCTDVFRPRRVGTRPCPFFTGMDTLRCDFPSHGKGVRPGPASRRQGSPNAPGVPIPQPTTPRQPDTRRNLPRRLPGPVRAAASWKPWPPNIVAAAAYVLVRVSASVGLVIFAEIIARSAHCRAAPAGTAVPEADSPSRLRPPASCAADRGGRAGRHRVPGMADELDHRAGDDISKVITQAYWLQTSPAPEVAHLSKIATNLTQAIRGYCKVSWWSGATSTVRAVSEALASLLVLPATFSLVRDGQPIWAWVVRRSPAPPTLDSTRSWPRRVAHFRRVHARATAHRAIPRRVDHHRAAGRSGSPAPRWVC